MTDPNSTDLPSRAERRRQASSAADTTERTSSRPQLSSLWMGHRRRPSSHDPRVSWASRAALVGAIGAVTIVLPLTGIAPITGADGVAAVAREDAAREQLAQDRLTSGLSVLASHDGSLDPSANATEIPSALMFAAHEELADRAASVSRSIDSRADEPLPPDPLPGCDGVKRVSGSNGALPSSDLCSLWPGASSYQLRADAAVALAKLNALYQEEFGTSMCVNSGYRTYAQQASMNADRPGLVAAAGRSNHGLGLAVDLCGGLDSAGSARWNWMAANGPDFGWDNPGWARSGGIGPYEPWHWEFEGGGISYG